MADVFINYKREDRPQAEALVRAFESVGYSVWWDTALVEGSDFATQIEKEIQAAKCLVTVWTARSAESKWARYEAEMAWRNGTYVGAVLEAIDLPLPFAAVESISIVRWSGDLAHAGFQDLLKAVQAKVGRKPKAVQRADAAGWAIAQAAGAASALEQFAASFPSSPFVAEAKRRLAGAKANVPKKGKAFISYRRDDSQPFARLVYERLIQRLGPENVFFDVEGIPIGRDFREHMFERLVQCSTLLAIIGPDWLGRHSNGVRIADPNDFVRKEIELALENGLRIIPVLVGQALMPSQEQLPESLRGFSSIQAARLDLGPDYESHVHRLLSAVTGEKL